MKNILLEWADALWIDGKKTMYNAPQTYAFGFDEKEAILSQESGTHGDIKGLYDPKKPQGRIWEKYKAISFWDYPNSQEELYELVNLLNDAIQRDNLKFKIDKNWTVESPADPDKENRGGKDRWVDNIPSFFVPIDKYNPDFSKNPTQFFRKMAMKADQHRKSPLEKQKAWVPPGWGSKKKIAPGLSHTQYASMRGVAESKLNEWADSINYNDKNLDWRTPGSYPFGYHGENEQKIHLGEERSMHYQSGISSDRLTETPCSGRIWTKEKIISFWKYPENDTELKWAVNQINGELEHKNIQSKIDSYWKVEIPLVHDVKFSNKYRDDKSVFIPLDSYDYSIVKNPIEFKEEMEKRYLQHTESPLKKKKKEIPSGWGSKFSTRVAPSQYAAIMGIAEHKTKIKNLLRESVEHKIALELIRDKIKGTEWEGKTYLAGGAVRDELMGKSDIKDLDLTISAPNGGIRFAEWLAKELGIYKENSNPVLFPRFGTAKITLTGVNYKGKDLSSVDVETVMTRKETYTAGSRKPDTEFGTPEQDAERRDLTVNSLMKDLSTGEIKDFTGKGIEDLKKGLVRTPLNPDIIFKEDPLRMLRAIRFAVKYNWKLPLSMIKALKENAPMLQNISAERIQDELNKILLTENPHKGVRLLVITGLNDYIAPEFKKLVNMAQNDFHEWSAARHTYEVLKNSKPELIVRLAGMLHDIGKGETRTEKDGKVHFYGHEMRSADIARKIMNRLKYPNDVIDAVVVAVKNHMRTKNYGKDAEMVSDKALRKLMNDLGDHLDNTLELIHADNVSHGKEGWKHNLPNQVQGIKDRLKKLGDFTGKLKIPINGNDVIQLLQREDPNFKKGPVIAQVLDAVKDKFLENPGISREEAEKIVIDTYRSIVKGEK